MSQSLTLSLSHTEWVREQQGIRRPIEYPTECATTHGVEPRVTLKREVARG